MIDDDPNATTCPRCGGRELVCGSMGYEAAFFPTPKGRWFGVSSGRRVKAFVCLGCGVVTQYLSHADVDGLRKKYFPPT